MNWKELILGKDEGEETEEVEELDEESIEEVDESEDEESEEELSEEETRQAAIEKALSLLNGPSDDDTEPIPEIGSLDAEELLKGIDFEAMYTSPEVLESTFTGVVSKLVSRINELQKESVNVSRKVAQRTTSLRELSDRFYDQNEDLQEFKPIMRLFANEVMKEEPGIKPHALMEKAAERTREALFGGGESVKGKKQKPAFPSKAKTKRGKKVTKKSKLQKEMDEMFGRS